MIEYEYITEGDHYEMKRTFRRTLLLAAALSVINLAVFFLWYAVFRAGAGSLDADFGYIEYTIKFTDTLIVTVIPALAMAGLSATEDSGRTLRPLFRALPVLLSSAFYRIPREYIVFVYDRYPSAEAIIISLLEYLAFAAVEFVLVGTVYILTKRIRLPRYESTEDYCAACTERISLTDFGSVTGAFIGVTVLIFFALQFVSELVDTITFFSQYFANYTVSEVIYIAACYVIIILCSALSYVLAVLWHNWLAKFPAVHENKASEAGIKSNGAADN